MNTEVEIHCEKEKNERNIEYEFILFFKKKDKLTNHADSGNLVLFFVFCFCCFFLLTS